MVGAVTVSLEGREGQVRYSEGPGRLIEGYFEFGANAIIAIVSFGSEDEWRNRHPWAVARRAEILRFIAAELVRRDAARTTPDIDETAGVIRLLQAEGAPPPAAKPSARPKAAAFFWRLNKLKSAVALAVLAATVVLGGLALFAKEAITMSQPAGAPLNESVRYEGGVATLIMRTDPQGPRWSGRGGGETVTVSLLLIPFDGGEPRLTPLVRAASPGGMSLARVIGSDGVTLWTDAGGLRGVRLRDAALVTQEDLQPANPGLDRGWWDDARGAMIIDRHLHLFSRGGGSALAVDPETLLGRPTAAATPPPRLSPPEQAEAMGLGYLTGDGGWLGLLTEEDQAGAYRVGRWVRPIEDAEAAHTNRFLTRAAVEPASDRSRFRLRAKEVRSETPYLNAAFLRLDPRSEPLRLQDPPGALMIHTLGPVMTGTLLVSRVDDAGHVLWTAETGLDRFTLRQILPGMGVSVFVGARLPVAGQLSEPLVVLVAHDTGAVTTHSLWR